MNNEMIDLQNAFHEQLTRYVNGTVGGRINVVRHLLWPDGSRQARAQELTRRYAALCSRDPQPTACPLELTVPPYEGNNTYVQEMVACLRRTLADDLEGAYIHGSLGSGEEVAYSDFDALVILKEEVLGSPQRLARVGKRLQWAQGIMLKHDPLQHHGWFVLTPYDLRQYCEAYFPAVLFRHARSLMPQGGHLVLHLRDSGRELRDAFLGLCRSVHRLLAPGNHPANLYQLKSLLSQFMLLPAMYVQVRDGQGVWKADSFDAARGDFGVEEWEVMKMVSEIRHDWPAGLLLRLPWLAARSGPVSHYLRKRLGPPIPAQIRARLRPEAYAAMDRLVCRMEENLAGVVEPTGHCKSASR